MATRRIRLVGSDSDFLHFATPSWTRPKATIEHNLAICKRTGHASCTCEDALYRRKSGNLIPTDKEQPCKHVVKLLDVCRRAIERESEQAVAA